MVALAIVALAVPALLFTLNQQIDGTARIRDRSLAQMVATNRLEELRLALRSGAGAIRGNLNGSEEFAGREWFWQIQTTNTEVPQYSRIELQIRDREDAEIPLHTLVAFMSIDTGANTGG